MKIEQEIIDEIRAHQKKLGEISLRIARLDHEKYGLHGELARVNQSLSKINNELVTKYGADCEIDLSTGIVKQKEEQKLN
jgi:hypothetical protein